jgi:4-hydroxyphenylacetate 3-hydroxylase, reductase component
MKACFLIENYKKMMSKFATGVTIATCKDEKNNPFGITINAFASLSLDPLLLLFCLGKESKFRSLIDVDSAIAINILSDDQREISTHFARPYYGDKWDDISYIKGQNGAFLLPDSLGSIEAKVVQIFAGGDHDIITCAVEAIHETEGGDPLVYFGGTYRKIINYI